jgi:hypothetical protein
VTKPLQLIRSRGRRQGILHVRAYWPGNDVLKKCRSPKRNVIYGDGRVRR